MFDIFNSFYKSIPINDFMYIREPSAAITNLISDRISLFTQPNSDGVPKPIYRILFVIPLLYTNDDKSLCMQFFNAFINNLNENDKTDKVINFTSVEDIFKNLDNELFIKFICSCAASVPLSKVNEWFKAIEDEFYITEKSKAELKND